jgi:RimJ/RimL family protein N-acetyltransferase
MLSLRRARPDDEARVLRWRNEESAREASFRVVPISPDEHHAWFTRKLGDEDCVLLIVEEDGRPVGQVRLDRLDHDLAEISIGLAPEARGRGLGREALRRSVLEASRLLGVSGVRARVKPENAASLAAFTAAGFRVTAESENAVELLRELDPGPATGQR